MNDNKPEPVKFEQSRCVAITTRYLGPTNFKGSRIVAEAGSGLRCRIVISCPDDREPHAAAAEALCLKMGWSGTLLQGGTKDGEAFVFMPKVQP